MSETYCGNCCDSCTLKEKLSCPACRVGPGKQYGGDCSISKCCGSKGYQSCDLCAKASSCITLRGRTGVASTRLKKNEKEAADIKRRLAVSQLMGTWMMILFWIIIVSNVANFIIGLIETEMQTKVISGIVSTVFILINSLIMFKLSYATDSFCLAGIFGMVHAGLSLADVFIDNTGLGIFLALAILAASIAMEYNQFMGYAEITEDFDSEYGEKWSKLWIAELICLCASGAGLLLTLLGMPVGAILVVPAALAALVIAIFKIVYLYGSAKFFREYAQGMQYNS